MPTARVATAEGVATVAYEDGVVRIDGETRAVESADDLDLLPPCDPRGVYCLGRNYPAYVETNADTIQRRLSHDPELPDDVHFFLKGATSVVGPGEPIPYPTFSDSLGYGGELAAVVDRTCRHVAPGDVPEVVRGYTILNDLDAKDQDGITEMKVFDGSAPLGPAIADVDPTSLEMRTTIDGEVRQEASTADMHRGPGEAIAAISERVTLHPGDVVALGSPANPGTVGPGDTIEIWYEGIGTLRNTVAPPRGRDGSSR
jgi:2-keto-4-pentenoate hydratase/2-oxohepta-3-ene-1,7-dioic acid hydratase in catechol pathway